MASLTAVHRQASGGVMLTALMVGMGCVSGSVNGAFRAVAEWDCRGGQICVAIASSSLSESPL